MSTKFNRSGVVMHWPGSGETFYGSLDPEGRVFMSWESFVSHRNDMMEACMHG